MSRVKSGQVYAHTYLMHHFFRLPQDDGGIVSQHEPRQHLRPQRGHAPVHPVRRHLELVVAAEGKEVGRGKTLRRIHAAARSAGDRSR